MGEGFRPLTLLNTFFMLISSKFANLMKLTLSQILWHEQKAYIPGGHISKCTITTYDFFSACQGEQTARNDPPCRL